MKKTLFIKNAAVLTASSLILRFAGILFKVKIATLLGSEGVGLYGMIFSVFALASTFATSGISTAVTRLVSVSIAKNDGGVRKIVKKSAALTEAAALVSSAAVYFGAEFIGKTLLNDKRAILSVKLLPIALLSMGISSVIRGYFYAYRKTLPTSICIILEQAMRIGISLILIKKFLKFGTSVMCASVIAGDVIAEFAECLILYAIYKADISKKENKACHSSGIVKKIVRIALPITSGRYLSSLLRTSENLLVPKSLAKNPQYKNTALSQFGKIKGMALPILFFPGALLNSISTLLIPEMSEAAALGRKNIVKNAAELTIKLTSAAAFILGALFFAAGDRIGLMLYSDKTVGYLIRVLSPLVPLMYLDAVCDGLLKGLDEQKFCFRTSVGDSAIRVAAVVLLLPKYGNSGFIGIMYFSNILTCFLNTARLIKVSGAKIRAVKEIILPLLFAAAITLFVNRILMGVPDLSGLVYIIFLSIISAPLYFAALLLFGSIKTDDIKGLLS